MRKVTSWSVVLLLAAPVVAASVLSSCGSGAAGAAVQVNPAVTTKAGPIVYVSETSENYAVGTFSGLMEAFSLDVASGTLSPISGSPFSTNYASEGDMALNPNGSFAYVLAQGTCCVAPMSLLVYSIDPTSGAPALQQALVTGASELATVSVHPSGQFIYLSPYSDTAGNFGIGGFSVQSDGTVASTGFTQVQSQGGATISPDGKFLYIDSMGAPIGNWGNSSCGPVSWNLWAFSVNSTTGALTAVPGSPFVFQRELCEVGNASQYITKQIDPAGEHLFVVDSGNATVTVFAINSSTGALTPLPGTSTDSSVGGFYSSAIDPAGRFLYIGSSSSFFTGFSLTANATGGTLPLLPGMSIQATPTPFIQASRTMAIDSSGVFLFSNENEYTSNFSCCGPDALVEFKINPAAGALVQVSSTPITLVGAASRIVAAPPQ